ncbi:MAG: PaREP1 family protein [Candidatus Bathyarchaeia archaeon]
MNDVMASRTTIYFEDACRFYEEALKEFEEGIRENNAYKIRDSAEKAWNAIIQATNALILKLTEKLPSSHWERRRMLRELEAKLPEIGRLMLRDRYGARERHLHEMVFYEGNIDVEDIKYELERVKAYLNDVSKILRSTKE